MKNSFRKSISWWALAAGVVFMGAAQTASAQDAKAGGKKADLCIGCHGIVGYQASFPEVYKVPKLAGQSAKYIVSALTEYQKGGRKHPSMRAVASALSAQDMADLAAFYSTQAGDDKVPAALADKPSTEVAAVLTRGNCTSCHGVNFSMPIDPSYPKLAGQYKDYLAQALKAYQTHDNRLYGRNNAIMMGMAAALSPHDIDVLSGYISDLPSELETVPQSRWR